MDKLIRKMWYTHTHTHTHTHTEILFNHKKNERSLPFQQHGWTVKCIMLVKKSGRKRQIPHDLIYE